MKNKVIALALVSAGLIGASAAQAQSSVVLYGVIDAGVSYVNHAAVTGGSKSLFKYDDGVAQGSRWGLKGNEDLGGGLSAIFVLENGFNSGTGTLGQGSRMFGRQAFVGLTQRGVGTLSLGRQYTFSTDFLAPFSGGNTTAAGNYGFHINDIDQLTSSRANNAIKYTSDVFAGLKLGAMYAFSNTAGAFSGSLTSASRIYSFGASYAMGPLSAGAAYTDIHFPGADGFSTSLANVNTQGLHDLRTFGLGAKYRFGPAQVWGLWTNTHFTPVNTPSSTVNIGEIGVLYALTPALSLSGAYTFTDLTGNYEGKWHQVNLTMDYALTKRTDVYVLGVYQKAVGSNNGVTNQAEIGSSTSYFGNSGSGSTNQIAARVGIRHKF
ncbi:porin [Robbsia andropogonis]|uniref:porin n=1 Tax=Robbsia andropogonis TaxID=28092 RepID=UPI000467CA5A|nr:porin [Robbsia andropogonis]